MRGILHRSEREPNIHTDIQPSMAQRVGGRGRCHSLLNSHIVDYVDQAAVIAMDPQVTVFSGVVHALAIPLSPPSPLDKQLSVGNISSFARLMGRGAGPMAVRGGQMSACGLGGERWGDEGGGVSRWIQKQSAEIARWSTESCLEHRAVTTEQSPCRV